MSDIRARELRNDLGTTLRRVRAGERLRVTLRGLPVAELVPVPTRPQTMTWAAFRTAVAQSPADAELGADLAEALGQSTDDVRIA